MSLARAAPRCLLTLPRSLPLASLSRPALTRSYASGHGEPSYNEPSGYLFGEKPPPPGQKRQREPWELIWYFGMYGGLAFAAVALYFQPDTRIQTWALKQAEARLDASGEKWRYEPPSERA